jgi:micrococcal nuclease
MVSKKRIFLLVGLLIVGFLELNQWLHVSPAPPSQKDAEVTKEATTTGILVSSETATVKFVIDGDTIELVDGRRVRYIGIDAPEENYQTKSADCFASHATEENKRLVAGKVVRLEKDVSHVDSYGRLLRYVFVEDQFINERLVRDGFARAWNVQPDELYKEKLLAAQQEAQNNDRGRWQLCRK